MEGSVEIVKNILESNEGRKWFTEYLQANQRVDICANRDGFEVKLYFNESLITRKKIYFHLNPLFTDA